MKSPAFVQVCEGSQRRLAQADATIVRRHGAIRPDIKTLRG
jgi:hypothetical protein